MKYITSKTIIVILIGLIVFLTFRSCELKRNYQLISNALTLSDLTNQKFKVELNNKNEEIAFQKQVILTKDQAIKSNLLEIQDLKEYKHITSKIQVKTETKIDTIFIPYIADSDSINKFVNPFKKHFDYTEKNNWFKLNGYASENGIVFNSISIKNKFSLIIADKKIGILGKSDPVIVLKNYNPYTETITLNNVQITYSKPFYKKEWFWFVAGITTGQLILK